MMAETDIVKCENYNSKIWQILYCFLVRDLGARELKSELFH